MFFTLFGVRTRAYGLSIVLQLPPHLLTLISSEFILTVLGQLPRRKIVPQPQN